MVENNQLQQEKQPEEKKSGLSLSSLGLGSKKKEERKTDPALINKITDVSRALRTIEERYNNLNRRSQLTDNNILSFRKKVHSELKTTESDVIDIKKEVQNISDKLNMIDKELDLCAKKEEVLVLEKYLKYWQPLNFVTRKEAGDIIRDILAKKKF